MELTEILADVRRQAVHLAANAWAGLGEVVEASLPDPLYPMALLPVATGLAVRGELKRLVQLSAALVTLTLSLRSLDDMADGDNPNALYLRYGYGQTAHLAAALQSTSIQAMLALPIPGIAIRKMLDEFFGVSARFYQAQLEELRNEVRTLAQYRRIVSGKTVGLLGMAARSGGWMATADPGTLDRLAQCGEHIGWLLQIFDDVEATWFPDGQSEIAREHYSFPLLTGLEDPSPAAVELKDLCDNLIDNETRVLAVLDKLDVRRKLIETALDHRDKALHVLDSPFHNDGQAVLQVWLDWLFGDARRLLNL